MQHPLGILKSLNKLKLNSLDETDKRLEQLDQVELNETLALEGDKRAQLFNLLINACELFNFNSIKRCTLLNPNQKRVLLHYAKNPLKLKHISRLSVRRYVFKFATIFFNDDENASSSSAFSALENRFQQQHSFDYRSKSFDCSSTDFSVDNWPNHDLMQDSYLYNKQAYKKYVGNRYQKCINRVEEKLFHKPDTKQYNLYTADKLNDDSDKLVFNQEFAIKFGLTTEEMEIVKARKRHQLNGQAINRLNLKNKGDEKSMINSKKDLCNVAQLPIDFRVSPSIEWPVNLIELDSKFNDYNHKYYSSLKDSASTSIDQLREYFNFDSDRFKCSASYAIHILDNLPVPVYLRKYLLYEED